MRSAVLLSLLLSSGCLTQCGAIGGGSIGHGAIGSGAIGGTATAAAGDACGSPPGTPSLHYAARLETEYANTDVVPTATDQGSLGVNAAQATGSAQPTFVADCINGLPCYSFDGGDYLRAPSASMTALAQPNMVVVVARIVDIASATQLIFDGAGGNPSDRNGIYSDDNTGALTMVATSADTTALTFANNTWHSVLATFNGLSSEARLDGASEAVTVGTNNLDGVTIGATFQTTPTLHMGGSIAEIIVYDTPAVAAEVETYLECLYGEFPISSFALPFTARDAANDDVEIEDVWTAGVAA